MRLAKFKTQADLGSQGGPESHGEWSKRKGSCSVAASGASAVGASATCPQQTRHLGGTPGASNQPKSDKASSSPGSYVRGLAKAHERKDACKVKTNVLDAVEDLLNQREREEERAAKDAAAAAAVASAIPEQAPPKKAQQGLVKGAIVKARDAAHPESKKWVKKPGSKGMSFI